MATNKRLIDAGRHERILRGFAGHLLEAGKMEAAEAVNTLIKGLKLEPTVDAVEVVHGHWFSLTDCSNAGVYCSVCNKKVWKEDYAWCNRKNKLRSNYCPNCGAKMDGDGNG